ncbi:Rieske (2Fe-2S) protein [Streptomyces tropicalis]|uniref:Cytochrome bc1 complex Rieske iron-sulfur subunit n=1 Tax=Streptomyces tropicalis TaxID=3034234 RepID=A0ABT6A5T7_9ACTN|nr:Rieske (2Fe-2S) protein [Streptomyces tropicalis]MDF3300015.1 Rieske (2Fe-2S) protein [Streptomyces tropicalis]
MTDRSTRRTVLATGAAALVTAGCGSTDHRSSTESSPSPESPGKSAAQPSAAQTSASAGTAAGPELARTADIPEGGGTVFAARKVVVTQPKKGEFRAFSAICTHEGCLVNRVADGTIDCPCHGSRFHVADGSVAHGPAERPLPAKRITVQGNSIHLA